MAQFAKTRLRAAFEQSLALFEKCNLCPNRNVKAYFM